MKTILVLGVGLASAPVIRQTMKNTVLKSQDFKMIVVGPNTHWLWPVAMPRAVLPGQFADEKVMFELEPTFKEYPADKFEFVLGTASSLDPDGKAVTISLNDGGERSISYDTLIIATGSSANEQMPWKSLGNTDKTKERLHKLQKDIQRAKTIAVAGGGATGAETAGELGFEYSKSGKKEVLFIYNGELPMGPLVIDSVRKQIVTELTKYNVKLMPSTRVVGATPEGNDTVLELRAADGTTKSVTVQAYLPTFGLTPNTFFVPAKMLDANGYVKQTKSLQAEGYSNIIVAGDAGSLEKNKALYADLQAAHLVKNLPAYLAGEKMVEYQPGSKEMNAITLGKSRGTGHMGRIKFFSFIVWYLKGRFLGTDYAANYAAGKRAAQSQFEK